MTSITKTDIIKKLAGIIASESAKGQGDYYDCLLWIADLDEDDVRAEGISIDQIADRAVQCYAAASESAQRKIYAQVAMVAAKYAVSLGLDIEAAVPGITEECLSAYLVADNAYRADEGFRALTREELIADLIDPIGLSAFWIGARSISAERVDAVAYAAYKYISSETPSKDHVEVRCDD